jgi:hypothetical protein
MHYLISEESYRGSKRLNPIGRPFSDICVTFVDRLLGADGVGESREDILEIDRSPEREYQRALVLSNLVAKQLSPLALRTLGFGSGSSTSLGAQALGQMLSVRLSGLPKIENAASLRKATNLCFTLAKEVPLGDVKTGLRLASRVCENSAYLSLQDLSRPPRKDEDSMAPFSRIGLDAAKCVICYVKAGVTRSVIDDLVASAITQIAFR